MNKKEQILYGWSICSFIVLISSFFLSKNLISTLEIFLGWVLLCCFIIGVYNIISGALK